MSWAGVSDTPNRIEKSELSDMPINSHGNGRSSSQLGAHDAALTASQGNYRNAF